MTQRNELVPLRRETEGSTSRDKPHDSPRVEPAPRLKTPAELSAAADQLMTRMAKELLGPAIGNALMRGLKFQLDCSRAGAAEGPEAAADMDYEGLAELFAQQPALFKEAAPGLRPDVFDAVIRQMRGDGP